MKTRVLTLLLIAALTFAGASKPAQASVGVSIGFFYNELSPYGRWVNCSYGYAWVPTAATTWQPYADGEWIWTEYGWTWVSYDPWPDDPFHYGSWFWDAEWGWAWAPGFVWSPAWVTWCYGDGFVGWAPLPPTFAFAAYGYSGGPVVAARSSYVFVPGNQFVGTSVAGVRMPVSSNSTFLGRGRSVTSFGVASGVVTNTALPMSRVQAAMGRPVPVRSLSVARTDPRPAPRASGGRLTLAAPPSVVRSELSGKPIASGTRSAPAMRVRGGARTLITNGAGGPVRLSTSPKETFDRGPQRRVPPSTGAVRTTGAVRRVPAPATPQRGRSISETRRVSTVSRVRPGATRYAAPQRRAPVRSAPAPAAHLRSSTSTRRAAVNTRFTNTRTTSGGTQPAVRRVSPFDGARVRPPQSVPARIPAPVAPPRAAGPPAGRQRPTPSPRNRG